MASKDNSPAISFFSFQDIITSITGIMFLVVIMLVLMVLQQPSSAANQKARELQKELTELEQELKQLQDALAKLRKQAAEQEKRIEELKKLRLETLPELKKEWIRKLQITDNMIRQLEEEDLQIRKEQQKEIDRMKKSEIAIQKNSDQAAELRKELALLDEKTKQKEKIYLKFKNVIRFVWDKSNPKTPVLLECSDKEISVNPILSDGKRKTFSDFTQCMNYCRTFSPENTYFILLLKPSAFRYAEDFSWELQKAGYERGREILPDEQSLITGDPQK